MTEAQVCCQKVGIMKNGALTTIGTPLEICKLYSNGYSLTLKIVESKRDIAEKFISTILPIITNHNQINQTLDRYIFQASTIDIARIFSDLKTHSLEYNISSWELCANSLADAFQTIHADDPDNDFEKDFSLWITSSS